MCVCIGGARMCLSRSPQLGAASFSADRVGVYVPERTNADHGCDMRRRYFIACMCTFI